ASVSSQACDPARPTATTSGILAGQPPISGFGTPQVRDGLEPGRRGFRDVPLPASSRHPNLAGEPIITPIRPATHGSYRPAGGGRGHPSSRTTGAPNESYVGGGSRQRIVTERVSRSAA